MLENALADVAGQKQAVSCGRRQRREKPQLRRSQILRLVDDYMIERLGGARRERGRQDGENIGPGGVTLRRQRLSNRRDSLVNFWAKAVRFVLFVRHDYPPARPHHKISLLLAKPALLLPHTDNGSGRRHERHG
jgi:hypothetical protein